MVPGMFSRETQWKEVSHHGVSRDGFRDLPNLRAVNGEGTAEDGVRPPERK